MRKDEKEVSALLGIAIIYFVLGVVWAAAEMVIYGERTPRGLDSAIGLVLAISLYANWVHWIKH